MKIYEEIGELPLWKAVIVSIVVIGILSLAIEELFIGKIFSNLDKGITGFEKIANEEKNEIDRDYKAFDEKAAYDDAMYEINGMMLNQFIGEPDYLRTCNLLQMQKKLEKLNILPFVKKNDYVQGFLASRINLIKSQIANDIAKHKFNPKQCDEAN